MNNTTSLHIAMLQLNAVLAYNKNTIVILVYLKSIQVYIKDWEKNNIKQENSTAYNQSFIINLTNICLTGDMQNNVII